MNRKERKGNEKVLKSWRPLSSPMLFLCLAVLAVVLFLTGHLTPKNQSGATPAELRPGYQEIYLDLVAYRCQTDPGLDLDVVLGDWEQTQLQSALQAMLDKTSPADSAALQRLHTLAAALDVKLIRGDGIEVEQKDDSAKPLLLAAVLVCLLAMLAALGFLGARYRNRPSTRPSNYKLVLPPTAWEDEAALPLRQFSTSYTFGDDYYDPSFSIESAKGEFLGECGVGFAHKLNQAGHKQVSALEVWLFDKADIRTTQKFLVSSYAYQDPTLHAKLSAQGELVVARPGQTLTLQTAALRLRARVVEAQYAESEHGERSIFGLLTVELGVWRL